MTSPRVAIAGMTGRMGVLLREEVACAGCVLAGGSSRAGPSLASLLPDADVVIDFTNAAAAANHAALLARAGVAWVLGTSGLSAEDEVAVQTASDAIPVVYAPNFAPGVNLVLALAERMAASLPAERYDAEIVEMHHRQKVDAPSGTAMGLGRAVARGRGVVLADVMVSGRDGHTGPRPPGAIGFAALRGGQVVGEHTLLFAAGDEHIALTHRAFDRRAFAVGAVQAARWAAGRGPGLYDMMDVLGMR
jgi:4-hydroxy-tetrahydrodipicolinate reductase